MNNSNRRPRTKADFRALIGVVREQPILITKAARKTAPSTGGIKSPSLRFVSGRDRHIYNLRTGLEHPFRPQIHLKNGRNNDTAKVELAIPRKPIGAFKLNRKQTMGWKGNNFRVPVRVYKRRRLGLLSNPAIIKIHRCLNSIKRNLKEVLTYLNK